MLKAFSGSFIHFMKSNLVNKALSSILLLIYIPTKYNWLFACFVSLMVQFCNGYFEFVSVLNSYQIILTIT